MVDHLSLHLQHTGLPDGQIAFSAAGLLTAFQTLATRIGRHLTGHEGPGRSTGAVQRATELRLRGLREGSAVLDIAVGEEGVLIDDGLEGHVTDRVFELFTAIAR